MIDLGGTRLPNQGDRETEAAEGVSALVDTASNAPLKTDASYRERHEATRVLLRAAEEATFAEARSYDGRCYACAAANDVLKTAAHLADQCAHCSACVLAETPDTGCWSITAPSSVPCSALVGLDEGGTPMSRSYGYSVAARAGQMRCAPIKSQLLPTKSLMIGVVNGLLVLIISAGFVVPGVAYAIAISSLTRDFFAAQSESTDSGAIRNALWRARDQDAEPR